MSKQATVDTYNNFFNSKWRERNLDDEGNRIQIMYAYEYEDKQLVAVDTGRRLVDGEPNW